MAVKIEGLNIDQVRLALETHLSSLKRQHNTTKQPAFKPILDKDITAMQIALTSLTEIADNLKR